MKARLHRFVYLEEVSLLDERLVGSLRLRSTLLLAPGIMLLHSWLTTGSLGSLLLSIMLASLAFLDAVYPRRTMPPLQLLAAYTYTTIKLLYYPPTRRTRVPKD